MSNSPVGRIFTVIFTLVIFVVILYLAYLTTKYIGKKYSVQGGMSGRNIKIIDSMRLSQDKLLMIVKVGDKAILVGVSKDHMEYICEVDENQLYTEETGVDLMAPGIPDFIQSFRTVLGEKINTHKSKENKDEDQK